MYTLSLKLYIYTIMYTLSLKIYICTIYVYFYLWMLYVYYMYSIYVYFISKATYYEMTR